VTTVEIVKEMQPKQLQMTRPEYMEFPLKVFSNDVNQVKSRRHQKSFWMNKGKKGQKSELSAAAAQKRSGSS
jgi:hypothetical protein